jgi:hypothetical protein
MSGKKLNDELMLGKSLISNKLHFFSEIYGNMKADYCDHFCEGANWKH